MSQSGIISTAGGPSPPIVATSYTADSGVAVPAANNLNEFGSGSITTTGAGSTITTQLTGLTNHAVLIGAGTTTITKIGPVASIGAVLQSNGLASDPGFSTATYPATTTVNQILYSSAANTVTGLATANNAILSTNGSGVPALTPISALTSGVLNLGVTYNAGTGLFSITAADGTALSSTNVGYVNISSKTAGVFKTIPITANQAFIDDNGASEIIGNLFGWTTSIAITEDVPFFIYAVLNDAENAIAFMLCRYSHLRNSTTAANIGFPGSAVADAESAFFSFDAITAADYESNPAICIGSIRMRMSNVDDWTVQTLAITDGIGQFQEQTVFNVPKGQLGAVASQWVKNNGGTAALFANLNLYFYRVMKDGIFSAELDMDGDPGTDGSGAVNAQVICPIKGINVEFGAGSGKVVCSTFPAGEVCMITPTSSNLFTMARPASADTNILWSAFGNGNRAIRVNISFMIATS
jgi:hypothetical protein